MACPLSFGREGSLPLMRKTFIEAQIDKWSITHTPKSLPLMRKTFIEAPHLKTWTRKMKPRSLPLMRKTFIEARPPPLYLCQMFTSLPLMRKTFIEANQPFPVAHQPLPVSSAYAEDFH